MLTTSSSSSHSSEPERSGPLGASQRHDEPDRDAPRHPKPRDFVKPVEPAAAPPVTEASAADHVDGDTVVTSSVVGSAAAQPVETPLAETLPATAPPAAAQQVDAISSEAPRAHPASVAAPPAGVAQIEAVMRAQPVVRAERIQQQSPALVAKVVPVAKAIPTAEPARHAPRAIAIAEPVVDGGPIADAKPVAVAVPVVGSEPAPNIIVTGSTQRTSPDGRNPDAVPLTMLGQWLWHVRNFGIAANASIFLHLIVIVVLGSIMLNTPDKPKPPPLLEFSIDMAVVKKPEPPPKIQLVEMAPIAKESTKSASSGSGSGSRGSKGGAGGGSFGGLQLKPIKIDQVANLTPGGSNGLGDTSYGSGLLQEVGDALDPKDAKATFFGVEAKGKSFVFVVDTSGSMKLNDRYLRCRAELLRSVGALKYQQKYFVVFFNHTTFAMPERKLVEARPAQITKTQEWCNLAVPSGGTDPWDGLQLALRLKPDAIYLLTDGDFDPTVVERLAHAQPQTKKIPIHTICFESLSGAPVMEAIAKQTNATYLYVP